MPIIGFFLFRKEPQGALHNITPVRKRGLECLGFTVRLYIYIYPTGFSRTWILAWPSHHEQWPVGPWLIWFAVYKWIDVVLPSYIRNLRSQRMDLYEPSRNGGMECHVHPWKLTWNLKITQLKSGNIIFHPPPWLWGSKCEFSGFFQGFERFLTCCFLFPPLFWGRVELTISPMPRSTNVAICSFMPRTVTSWVARPRTGAGFDGILCGFCEGFLGAWNAFCVLFF